MLFLCVFMSLSAVGCIIVCQLYICTGTFLLYLFMFTQRSRVRKYCILYTVHRNRIHLQKLESYYLEYVYSHIAHKFTYSIIFYTDCCKSTLKDKSCMKRYCLLKMAFHCMHSNHSRHRNNTQQRKLLLLQLIRYRRILRWHIQSQLCQRTLAKKDAR